MSSIEDLNSYKYVLTKKTSVIYYKHTNTYSIQFYYRTCEKRPFILAYSGGYKSKEDANNEIFYLRNAYEVGNRLKWIPYNQRDPPCTPRDH